VKRIVAVCAPMVFAILSLASTAYATPITYELSGTASGKIGTTTFTDAAVDLIGVGDTAGITSLFGGVIFGNPFTTFTITIGGVGTATITDQSAIWALPAPSGVSPEPAIVFGREDRVGGVPVLDEITGIGIVTSAGLAGYEDGAPVPSITDLGGIGFPACGGIGEQPCIHTTLGTLSFDSNPFPPTGEATFAAAPVPEPTTLFLLCGGLAALAGRSRIRARK